MYRFEKKEPVPIVEGFLNMGETSPSGENIYLNNIHLTKNGKPFIPVMGEMHISRCPREEWEERILKIKACGVDTIASYIFWINHEFNEGEFDFTGENDIGEFIRLCRKHGMYFALRFGPWVNAEYRNGGFPDWLFKSDVPLRENNDRYLFYVRRFWEALYENVKEHLFKNGGNIIMIQFDNERTRSPEHIMKLKEIALDIGFSAPIYTATGWNLLGGALLPERDVLPMFGGYAAKPWTPSIEPVALSAHYNFSRVRNSAEIGNDLIKPGSFEVHIDLDKYPNAACELGTGICISRHRRPFISPIDDYTLCLTKLGSGLNLIGYYLISGGANKMINDTTLCRNNEIEKGNVVYTVFNNDFQGLIGEHGNIKDSYRTLKLLNLFIQDFGEEFAPMQPLLEEFPSKKEDDTSLRYALRKTGDTGYIFVNHHAHLLDLKPVYDVQFEVENLPPIPDKPIDVTHDDGFFFPFNMTYSGVKFDYITAQPICKCENTYFFKEILGVKPVYKVDGEIIEAQVGKRNGFVKDGVRFITLSHDEAKSLYKFDGNVYFGIDCDLLYDLGQIRPIDIGVYEYLKFNAKDGSFERLVAGKDLPLAEVEVKEIEKPQLDERFFYELFENCRPVGNKAWRDLEYFMVDRKLKFYSIKVSNPNGFVYIDYCGDTAQLYYDGKMCDDNFYNGMKWAINAKHMYGKEVVLVISEYTHDIYVDIPPKHDLSLNDVYVDRI